MSPSVPKERSVRPSRAQDRPPGVRPSAPRAPPGAAPVHHLGSQPLMRVAEVGTNHWSTESPSQLHRVLEGGETLLCLVLLLDGEHGEVGSMHREPYVPLRRQFPETGTPPLLPGEPGDEGKLQSTVPPRHQVIEKRLVVCPLRRNPRDAEPDQRIVCHERVRMAGERRKAEDGSHPLRSLALAPPLTGETKPARSAHSSRSPRRGEGTRCGAAGRGAGASQRCSTQGLSHLGNERAPSRAGGRNWLLRPPVRREALLNFTLLT